MTWRKYAGGGLIGVSLASKLKLLAIISIGFVEDIAILLAGKYYGIQLSTIFLVIGFGLVIWYISEKYNGGKK